LSVLICKLVITEGAQFQLRNTAPETAPNKLPGSEKQLWIRSYHYLLASINWFESGLEVERLTAVYGFRSTEG